MTISYFSTVVENSMYLLYRESMRQEDLEQQLSRVECVISNYPPVDNFDMVVTSTIRSLQTSDPTFAFFTAPGECLKQTTVSEGENNIIAGSVHNMYIKIFLFYPGEGFCNAEMVNNVSWPETRSGSEPIVMACPENDKRNVTRECRGTTWSEADNSTCMSFTDIPVSTFASASIVSVLMLCV